MLTPAQVEAIERSTIEAVAPEALHELDGWLAPVDPGTIGRAKAAFPLRHDEALDARRLEDIEAIYRAAGAQPAFRLADAPGLAPIAGALAARGYRPASPTLVMVGELAQLSALSAAPGEVAEAPDSAWARAFAGEGFDPADAAHRVRNLTRSPGALFASVREGVEAVAVGAGAFGRGWASVHGMRTVASHRRRGLASRVLAGLARAGLERGYARVFLQVEEPNAAARALYARAGLTQAWRYQYWR